MLLIGVHITKVMPYQKSQVSQRRSAHDLIVHLTHEILSKNFVQQVFETICAHVDVHFKCQNLVYIEQMTFVPRYCVEDFADLRHRKQIKISHYAFFKK